MDAPDRRGRRRRRRRGRRSSRSDRRQRCHVKHRGRRCGGGSRAAAAVLTVAGAAPPAAPRRPVRLRSAPGAPTPRPRAARPASPSRARRAPGRRAAGWHRGPTGGPPAGPPACSAGGRPPRPPPWWSRWLALIVGLVLLAAGGRRRRLPEPAPGRTSRQRPASTSADRRPSASAAAPPDATAPPVATAVPIPSIGAHDPGRADPELRGRRAERPAALRRQPGRRRDHRRGHGRRTGDGAPSRSRQGPPQFIAFSRDGRRAYVSVWDEQGGTVQPSASWTRRRNKVTATIPVETRPFLSAVSPDGKLLYVPEPRHATRCR